MGLPVETPITYYLEKTTACQPEQSVGSLASQVPDTVPEGFTILS